MLSEKEINAVGDIKNILKDVILSNHGNTLEKTVEIFKEVVNQSYSDMNLQIVDIRILDEKLQTFIVLNKMKFDFELDLNIPKDDQRFQKLIDECEPWRKTSPYLVESDRKLKEWANGFGNETN